MSKKSVKNNGGLAGVRSGPAGASGGAAAGAAAAAVGAVARGTMLMVNDPGPIPPPKLEVRDALFELYVARVATIDRYRVPITDRGLPATYRKAFDEAVVALKVFEELDRERAKLEVAR